MITLEMIQETAISIAGHSELVTAADRCPAIRIKGAENQSNRYSFTLAPRDTGLFLFGFGGMYSVKVQDACFLTFLNDLFHASSMEIQTVPKSRAYQLKEYSLQKWREDAQRKEAERRRQSGWADISDAESEKLWDEFSQKLSFSLNLACPNPSLSGVFPLVTWDSKQWFADIWTYDNRRSLEYDARADLLKILCKTREDKLYGMSLNHTSYTFNPAAISIGKSESLPDPWPIDVIPEMDYRLIATSEFRQGFFTTTFDQRTYAFGSPFVGLLLERQWSWFGALVSIQESPDENL